MSKDLQIIKELEKALNIKLTKRKFRKYECEEDQLEESCYYSMINGRVATLNLRETYVDNEMLENLVSKLEGLIELNLILTSVDKISCLNNHHYLTVNIDYEDLDRIDTIHLEQTRQKHGLSISGVDLDDNDYYYFD